MAPLNLSVMLVTGSEGQLGTALKKKTSDLIGLSLNNADINIDVSDEKVVDQIIKVNPNVIVHAAAITDLDFAEKNPERTKEVNVVGTRNVLEAAKKLDAHLIFISTDYVFSGERGDYRESDDKNPRNVYGKTKLEAENKIKNSNIDYTILRTAVLFDAVHDNFFTWAMNQLRDNGFVNVVVDQVSNPTFVYNLADIIIEAAQRETNGIFHAAGNTKVSRYEAIQIMKEELNLKGDIKKIYREDINWKAKRPRDSSLDLSKIKSKFKANLISLYRAFEIMEDIN